ncbi:MAG: transporter substrate-binding domain-containing protein [Proteobacteria bacterium]|nr:transporter substrate-binding domain-containing protein [Pseudomonadota bacterium]
MPSIERHVAIRLLGFVVPLCLALAGCATMSAAPAPGASRLATIAKRGTVEVCTTGDYKPFSYYDPKTGAFEGIDIDMAHSLATALGVKPVFVRTTWGHILDDATDGRCDIAMGGISITLPRQKKASFSIPYLVDGKTPITRCENVAKFATLAEIDRPGVRVIVNPGGTNESFARAHLKHAAITVYPDNVTIFGQIVDGKADLMITDATETRLQHKLHPELCAVHPDKPFTFSEKGYLMPQGDAAYQGFVDQWLHIALADGTYRSISDRWLK